jgi:hypothetical protein
MSSRREAAFSFFVLFDAAGELCSRVAPQTLSHEDIGAATPIRRARRFTFSTAKAFARPFA